MAKNAIKQEQLLQQKLSQQNIQLFKLMELNLLQFEQKVKEELVVNPALDDAESPNSQINNTESLYSSNDYQSSIERFHSNLKNETTHTSLDRHYESKDYHGQEASDKDEREFIIPVQDHESLLNNLSNQLSYLSLTEEQILIGEFIIGSLEDDGYLRRSVDSIVDDLSFRQNFYTTTEAVEEVLEYIQDLDPPGIAARNLQECLILQLRRKKYSKLVEIALEIVSNYFELYSKKQFDRIQKKFKLSDEQFEEIQKIILSLNPKPISILDDNIGKFIIPDFFVYRNGNKLELELHSYNNPNLVINADFVEMLKKNKAEKKKSKAEQEAQEYIADKIYKANLFLSLIKERQETMVIVMNAILEMQPQYFLSGEQEDLRPMTLKDISEMTRFDISTISRITSSKYIQTEFGIIALKSLFTEGISTVDGGEVSNRKIMKTIESIVEQEDKSSPLSDDEITNHLEKLGFKIARRTTAKYRETLKIPPKHQRKTNHKL